MSPVEGWKSKQLLGLLSLVLDFRGKTPKKLGMEWGGGDIPALSANNVEMGKIDFSKECYFGSDALYRKWMTRGDARIGDVVLTTEAPLGNVAQIPDERRYILSQRAILLRANDAELCNEYLKHYLTSELFQTLMRQQSSGTTATGIQRAKLETLPVNFPISKREQTKVAEILSTVDQVIEQTEALIAKQQRIKTGLMQDLLTHGIDEHGNLRSELTHVFKDSPLGRIPLEWDTPTIDELAIHVGSGVTPRGGESVYAKEGVLFIRSQNVHFGGLMLADVSYIPQKIHDSMKRSAVFKNDVLLNITGASIGRCCPMPAINCSANVNQHVCAIRLNEATQFDAGFLTSIMESSIGQNQIHQFNAGGNREGLNYQQVRSFVVPWPKTDERRRSCALVNEAADTLKVTGRNLAKVLSLKTALMQGLLTGHKRVTSLLEAEAAQ
jgi:type I restriction enzyme S subunit